MNPPIGKAARKSPETGNPLDTFSFQFLSDGYCDFIEGIGLLQITAGTEPLRVPHAIGFGIAACDQGRYFVMDLLVPACLNCN